MKNDEGIPIWSVIWVDYLGYRHYGVYLGSNLVAHCSKEWGIVCIDSLENFSDGRRVYHTPLSLGAQPSEIWKRVRNALGKPYSLFGYNCEHFVNEAETGKPESPQVAMASAMVLTAIAIAIIRGLSFQKVALLVAAAGLLGAALANAYSTNVRASPV